MANITQPGRFRAGQLMQATTWTGLTEESHIDMAFGREPQWLSNVVRYLVDINMEMSFTKWLDQFPTKYVDTNQPFKWKLKGYNDKTVTLQAAYTDDGSTAVAAGTYPGRGGAYIYLDFPERRFTNTGIIVGENPDNYKFYVTGDPVQVGSNYRYRVRLITDDLTDYVPYDELTAGTRFSKEGGAVSRYGSTHGQDISFSTPFDMEERISALRMEHKIHGEMIDIDANKPFIFQLEDEEGNTHRYWLNYVEWELIKQFNLRKAENIFYGQTTVNSDGVSTLQDDNGNAIYQGRGLRNQFLPTNSHYYNTISLDFLTEVALDATVGKISPENRTFVIGTGEWGLMELHKMIQREYGNGGVQNYSWLGDTTGRSIEWTGGMANNELKLRLGQFMGVAVINGINFKFMWMPHYDNLIRNKKPHPKGGYAESHRFTIMDFGNKTEPNIHKIRIKGRDPLYRYIPGLRTPYSPDGLLGRKPAIAASSFDGYELHLMDWEGAVVLDPTRIIEFIPNLLKPRKLK